MKVIFVGTAPCTPDIGKEAASFMINKNILVDTGWCNVLKMREYGLDAADIKYLVLTHLHQDHYLGLPHLLFYLWSRRSAGKAVCPLTIVGPSRNVCEIVETSKKFLQWERFPELVIDIDVVPIVPGETYTGDDFILETIAAKHVSGGKVAAEALAGKITYPAAGNTMVFSGDTSFHPPLAEFARKTPLLIHDAAHSAPEEAAQIAKMAGAERLYLIHGQQKEEMLDDVRRIFPKTFIAREGLAVDF
ncbi:MAG: MBL fold metallo-hydrolase [Kiritimatiellae bacterium]|nr:MBL fold metallo-hydrolase [Kiritimatiellia bacterium]